jgi:GTP-binding protein Era
VTIAMGAEREHETPPAVGGATTGHRGSQRFRVGTIALVGRPNVGKSTLINRLVGDKVAIVSDVPQTTRTRVVGVVHRPDAQLILLDTPGLHRPRHRLNDAMVRAAHAALDESDVVFFLCDVGAPFGAGDRAIVDLLRGRRALVFLLLNKVDRIAKPRLLPLIDEARRMGAFAEIFPVSAARDDEFERLLSAAVERLPVGEALYPKDEYTNQTLRTMAAELIREPILLRTREEVPHAVAVRIDDFSEGGEQDIVNIAATILVEKDSQKGILIGTGGAMMKQTGEDARKEIERLLGRRVFLTLWVTVERGWRQNPQVLRELGYT